MKNFAWFGSAKVSGSSCVCISSGLSLKECVKNFAWFGLAKVGNGARCLNDMARQLSDLDPKNEVSERKSQFPFRQLNARIMQ